MITRTRNLHQNPLLHITKFLPSSSDKELTFHTSSPNQLSDAIHRILGQRTATKQHLPSEKLRISIIFAKSSAAKNFRPPKKSAPFNYNLVNAAKQ